MSKPRVSIIWLNYNSRNFIDIALRSLEAVTDLDYPNDRYELIVVDNGSTDGSFEVINEFLERKQNIRKKLIRLRRNLGFTGGNNVGFMARDPDSKYVVLLNNDAIPYMHSLRMLVEYAEQYQVAGVNGIILQYNSNYIYSAGGFIDELFITYLAGSGEAFPWVIKNRPFYVVYVEGSYGLFRIDAITKCVENNLFIDEFFGYYDDTLLGLLLWNCGYKLMAIPEKTAEHLGSPTFGRVSKLQWYLIVRNRTALSILSNSRYKNYQQLYNLKGFLTPTVYSNNLYSIHVRAIYDGIKLGRRLAEKVRSIDIYRAPIFNVEKSALLKYYIVGSNKDLLYYLKNKFIEKLKN